MNSRAMLSGSRNDKPEPYGASTMPPLVMPSLFRWRSHSSSSDRLAHAKARWSCVAGSTERRQSRLRAPCEA
jgi:hypothetical protein